MRTGSCTVQQALTPEAALVLKLSLNLSKRRGHAQVTPLHVAATLLTTSTSSSHLLRKACINSHPHHPSSHPLHCRALELCFNVALNRLPTNPPPSSGSLIHSNPSLSNALIAALKRAQAHQRRGCIEQQQQQHQHQQPLLALKVELEQLIISILDDPSVSRVMREAGFSSTSVKNNIEEDSSSVTPPPSSFFFDPHKEIIRTGSFLQTHFMKSPPEQNPVEDLRVVMEVMLKKQGRRSNTVVVGDSAASREGLVAELKGRVERGEVPDELKSAHFISLQLSYVHLRLMSKGDVDMKVSDLRAKICSLASERGGGGVIIHAGDLRWAVDDETGSDSRPVEHMIAEIGRLVSDLRTVRNRVWLMATASYHTYMRCQMREPSLETQWALQAVVVPSGGLALSLQAPSGLDSRLTRLTKYPFQMLESKDFSIKGEEDKLNLCGECTSNYEKEAGTFKPENGSSHLPCWMQPQKSDNHHKDALLELRRKWNRLCHSLHQARRNQIHLYHPLLFDRNLVSRNCPYGPSDPWRSTSSPFDQNKIFAGPHSIFYPDSTPKTYVESPNSTTQMKNRTESSHEVSLNSLKRTPNQEVRTTLALGSTLLSDSATSENQIERFLGNPRKLNHLLQENIPWQAESIPSIMDALLDCRPSAKKGTWLLLQGNDRIGKRRLALAMAESSSGSANRLIHINTSKLMSRASSFAESLAESLSKDSKRVVLIEDIDRAHANFTRTLAEGLKNGFFEDQFGKKVGLDHGIFILTTSISTELEDAGENSDSVLKMRLWVEEISPDLDGNIDLKRKYELDSSPNESKKPRTGEIELDLNICAEEEDGNGEEEDVVPSDLTQEMDGGDLQLPDLLLESIGERFTLNIGPDQSRRMSDDFSSKLARAFENARGSGEGNMHLSVDRAVVEELMAASGSFLESLFGKWLTQIFQTSLLTVRKGGKVVRLGVEGKEGNVLDCGFMGSALPNMIHVD